MGKPVTGMRSILVKALSYGILLFLILLCAYFNRATNGLFLSGNNVLNILQQTAINTIIAVGMTFVIISGGIDLSVGSVLSLAGVVSMTVLMHGFAGTHSGPNETAWPLAIAIPIAALVGIAVGAVAGALNGFFITKMRVTPFIATLAMMSVARGLAFVFTDARPVSPLPAKFIEGVGGRSIEIPGLPPIAPLVPVALLVVIAGYIVLTRTNFGRHVYAIGGSEEAARLSGVNVACTKLGVYAIAGLLAGLSGFMLSAWVAAGDPKSGNMYEMNAIA
ncbi:MAG: ABC transporter permease, partial [Armatimonadota bacterium]|nr:ABC transporter permease [Armatimonadota bacterium]